MMVGRCNSKMVEYTHNFVNGTRFIRRQNEGNCSNRSDHAEKIYREKTIADNGCVAVSCLKNSHRNSGQRNNELTHWQHQLNMSYR